MSRKTFKTLFLVKPSRISKKGESPVFMRITVGGQRIETTIALNVEPDKWNKFAEKVIGKDRKSQEVNNRLDSIRLRIMEIYRELELDGVEITPKIILDRYLGREDETRRTLLSVFMEHNERCRKLAGKDMSPATVMRYETSYRHTQEFIQFSYSKDDVYLEEVNHQFIKDYEFFLKTERNCNHNSATKYLKNFKKIIRIALANEWIRKDPFANIKFHLEEVERDFLEDHELKKLMEKKFEIKRLEVIRDAFVFCCWTGLAFSDVKNLKTEHLALDNEGVTWVRKRREKTNNMCNIPLMEVPMNILERYKQHPDCVRKGVLLPVPTNQKMNSYLKEIADLCGIKKQLTTHCGRHTYATSVCLANGVSIENVAKMLGHSDTKMTRHYARVLDKSILKDMRKVNERYKNGQSE